MDLNKYIKDHYKNRNQFAVQNNVSPQLVKYWCSKSWETLSYKTKVRIENIVKEL